MCHLDIAAAIAAAPSVPIGREGHGRTRQDQQGRELAAEGLASQKQRKRPEMGAFRAPRAGIVPPATIADVQCDHQWVQVIVRFRRGKG